MKQVFLAVLAAAFAAAAPGCFWSEDSPTSPAGVVTAPEEKIDLDSPTGGLTTADEAPAFGEPEEYAALSRERPVEDPIESTARYRLMAQARGARIYDFRAVWGNLPRLDDSSAAEQCPIDWSGTLHLEGGVIAMKRTIAFDPGDSLYRIDPSTIGWISRTLPHVDGIHVVLVVPPPPPNDTAGAATRAPALTIEAGPYVRTFAIEELASLGFIEPVDECGNGISIASVARLPGCPHGHLAGGWKMLPPDSIAPPDSNGVVRGVFRGIWVGAGGRIEGHLRGYFGVDSAGNRVFFGKYIDTTGRFAGILRGRYGDPSDGATEARRPHGWFAGEWIGERAVLQGRVRGHWIVDAAEGAGCFHGVWGMKCSRHL